MMTAFDSVPQILAAAAADVTAASFLTETPGLAAFTASSTARMALQTLQTARLSAFGSWRNQRRGVSAPGASCDKWS